MSTEKIYNSWMEKYSLDEITKDNAAEWLKKFINDPEVPAQVKQALAARLLLAKVGMA